MHFKIASPADAPRLAELWGLAFETTSHYKAYVPGPDADIQNLIKMDTGRFTKWMMKPGCAFHILVTDEENKDKGMTPGTSVATVYMEECPGSTVSGTDGTVNGAKGTPALGYGVLPGADVVCNVEALKAFKVFEDYRNLRGPHFFMLAFSVDTTLFRYGLGKRLGEYCLAIAKERGLPIYLVSVRDAKAFYLKLGFVDVPGLASYEFKSDILAVSSFMVYDPIRG